MVKAGAYLDTADITDLPRPNAPEWLKTHDGIHNSHEWDHPENWGDEVALLHDDSAAKSWESPLGGSPRSRLGRQESTIGVEGSTQVSGSDTRPPIEPIFNQVADQRLQVDTVVNLARGGDDQWGYINISFAAGLAKAQTLLLGATNYVQERAHNIWKMFV